MSKLLHVSASPHTRCQNTTTTVMADVVIALLPASAWGVYMNGWNAFLLILACVGSSVLAEYLYQKLMKKPVTIHDLSAFITGLLLALNLPPYFPVWMAVLGSVFAIIIVKQVYGGIGQNFMNPALAARCFLLISFGSQMNKFFPDGVSGATPLAIIKESGVATNVVDVLSKNQVSLQDMFFGNIAGTIGETSALMILIGAAYLLVRKVISFRIPLIYIGSFAIFMILFGGRGADMNYLIAEICGGGLLLGAFFMATDYTTSPITPIGQVLYGVILGVLSGIFRIYSGSAEGVSYAIIICNLLVPLVENVTIPKAFGKGARKHVRG